VVPKNFLLAEPVESSEAARLTSHLLLEPIGGLDHPIYCITARAWQRRAALAGDHDGLPGRRTRGSACLPIFCPIWAAAVTIYRMNGLTDAQLLREYTERRAEAAFGELVRRHVDLVYSAALRMVRDTHLAEDVTQGVILALSRSGEQLTQRPVLSGWLHRTAQNLAANAVRSDVRHRAREQDAAAMNDLLSTEPGAAWEAIAPHLDTALGELNEPDRDALLLRYFERKSAREIAQTLGTSEEAAQKRVNRAVDRLRELLAKRGVTAGAAGLVVLISANSVQAAPVGLALSIATSATLAATAVATLTTSGAAKTLAMTTLQKTLITTALVAAIGVATYEAWQASLLRAQVKTDQQQTLPQSERALPTGATLATLQNRVEVLEGEKSELAGALTQANADKRRLETEREQARRSAAVYKELVEQANSKEMNPTNAYPTPRHVWVAFGKLGRLGALSKEDESKLSPEEKSALEEARMKALEGLPNLVKAARQFDAARSSETDLQWDNVVDEVACLLYGALNLDEQQFGQVYFVMQKLAQDAKQKGLSKESTAPEAVEAVKQIMEEFKKNIQSVLTPDQTPIFLEIVTHFQVEPGKFGFNFSY
jgi:RNA polymerase sigma factor (sigma-70 family)